MRAHEFIYEKWSPKYKRSIDCGKPRGFSQRAHCQGKKKKKIDESPIGLDIGTYMPFRDKVDSMKDKALKLKQALSQETKETKDLLSVVSRIIKGDKTLTSDDKKRAKAQFFDILKGVGMIAFYKKLFFVPFITEIIVIVAKSLYKKTGVNILPSSFASVLSEDQNLNEDLRKWFKEKWVRFGPDGKIKGDCARGSNKEGKPKCLPQKKAYSLGKKGRASAAARKRRQDPNPNRQGKAKNVATKKKEKQS